MASDAAPALTSLPSAEDPTGGARPSSTRSIRAASRMPTATASATSPASRRGSTISRRSGVDAVWLSPFYPSALADGGYDVDDYRDVDPRLGTLADFDEMVAALHDAGIRVVVDIVPNHTSNRHEWFQEARRVTAGIAGPRPLHLPRRTRRRTARSRPPTGSRSSAARPGSAWPTGSGTCTSSRWSSPT